MKKYLLIGMLPLLASCVIQKFDPNELMMMSEIKQNAILGKNSCDTNPKDAFMTNGIPIMDKALLYAIYSKGRGLADNDSTNMPNTVVETTKVFSTDPVSPEACKEQFENVIELSSNIMKSLMRRN